MNGRKLALPGKEEKKAENWFSIDNRGWRRMNAGRSMASLIREGISNILDLTDVKVAKVTIEPNHVVIEDDSEAGFSSPDLITTVFLTDKEEDSNKRGRKGRGLKELISAGDKAVVETVGVTVTFNEDGTRIDTSNDRLRGTRVEIWSILDIWKQIDEAVTYLSLIVPPANVNLIINNKTIIRPTTIGKIERACIETVVITDGIQKSQYGFTDILVHEHDKDKKSWLYEMGVPVQEISCPWHIDVQQRVPMNDNRDTVSSWYLNSLQGLVLDQMIDGLTNKTIQDEWVLNSLTHCSEKTKAKIIERITGGKKAVIKTDNAKANDMAKQHGYEVIDTKHISSALVSVLNGKLPLSETVAKTIEASEVIIDVEPTEVMKKFADVHKYFAEKLVDHEVKITFYSQEADCTGMLTEAKYGIVDGIGTLKYNIQAKTDFGKPIGPHAMEILTHELVHEYAGIDHGDLYIKYLPIVCGRLCTIIFENRNNIPHVTEQKTLPTKSELITCIDCGAKREVKAQDIHQTKRCLDCQKKHRALKRSQKNAKD
jgi:hypothetical protein